MLGELIISLILTFWIAFQLVNLKPKYRLIIIIMWVCLIASAVYMDGMR